MTAQEKVIKALQLPSDATDAQVEQAVKDAAAMLKGMASDLGITADNTTDAKAEMEDKTPELVAAIEGFTKAVSGPLQRRAREAELEAEERYECPKTAHDINRRAARNDFEREFQKASDDLHFVGAVCAGIDWEKAEKHGLSDLELQRLASTKAFRAYNRLAARAGMKDLDSLTATGGLEWMDVGLSSQVIDAVRLERGAHTLFDVWPMRTNPHNIPYVPGAVQTFLIAQILSTVGGGGGWGAAAAPNQSLYPTAQLTLTAQKHGTLLSMSYEADEDAVFDLIPRMTQDIVRGIAEGRDDICINGDDTTGPPLHFDNDTPGVLGAAHRRLLATGMRYVAVTAAATQNMGVINIDAYRGLRRQLGRFHKNCAWIVSALGEDDMASLAQVETMDVAGPRATVFAGTIDQLLGYPVVISGEVRDDVANTGINAVAGNNFTTTILVNRNAFIWGERRKLQVKLVDAPWAIEEKAVYAAERIDWIQVQASGAGGGEPCVIGINQAN